MSSAVLHFEHVAGADCFLRVFNDAGEVLDFDDDTFKALGSATTPQADATEHTTLAGTGRSGYTVSLDLSKLNTTGAATRFLVKWYDDASPDAASQPISLGLPLTVQFSELADEPVAGHAFVSVTSTAGTSAHITAWLMWRGARVPLSGATCSLTLKEVGSASEVDLFTIDQTDKIGDNAIVNDRFELMQASPNFTADRQYTLRGTITLGGVTFNIEEATIVFG